MEPVNNADKLAEIRERLETEFYVFVDKGQYGNDYLELNEAQEDVAFLLSEIQQLKIDKAIAEAERDAERNRADLHVELEAKRAEELSSMFNRLQSIQQEREQLNLQIGTLGHLLEHYFDSKLRTGIIIYEESQNVQSAKLLFESHTGKRVHEYLRARRVKDIYDAQGGGIVVIVGEERT